VTKYSSVSTTVTQHPIRITESAPLEPRVNGKTRISNRKGKGKAATSGWDIPDGDIGDHQANDEENAYRGDDDDADDDEDDHIIRTEHLTLNGIATAHNRSGEGRGKGKGKGVLGGGSGGGGWSFEDPSRNDEGDLYE
jgi:hypothetical protein